MHTPPLPGIVADELSAIARRCTFRRVEQESTAGEAIGNLHDGATVWHLILTSGGTDGTWALVDRLPEGFVSIAITREAFEAIRGGTIQENGVIASAGASYRLQLWFDGAALIARTVRVTS